jgi:hypothetical protein
MAAAREKRKLARSKKAQIYAQKAKERDARILASSNVDLVEPIQDGLSTEDNGIKEKIKLRTPKKKLHSALIAGGAQSMGMEVDTS